MAGGAPPADGTLGIGIKAYIPYVKTVNNPYTSIFTAYIMFWPLQTGKFVNCEANTLLMIINYK